MSNVLFILGAGASAEGGCPTMCNFLERARDLRVDDSTSAFAEDYGRVHLLCAVLQRAFAKSRIDTTNLEEVFTAIEMAETMGGLAELTADDLRQTREAFLRLIAGTLDKTQSHLVINPIRAPDKQLIGHAGPTGYFELADLIREMREQTPRHRVDVITFNYDVGLDISLASKKIPFTYGVGSYPASLDAVRLCKLHGSLNWLLESKPNVPPVIHTFEPVPLLAPGINWEGGRQSVKIDTQAGVKASAEQKALRPVPFIVPPGEGKVEARRVMQPIWQNASTSLREAEAIFVMGYSLPETDLFFRRFFALSMVGDAVIRYLWVHDPALPPKERFQALISGAISERPGVFCHFQERFRDAVAHVREQYVRTNRRL